jgi:glutamyl-tRNA reductase
MADSLLQQSKLICLGLSHKTAPVEIRERIAFAATELGTASAEAKGSAAVGEIVVLSTCNRMELYATAAAASTPAQTVESLVHWLKRRFSLTEEIPADALFLHTGSEAAQHLFSVAGGLDSMVLGETEIFGQVKAAYQASHEAGATGGMLNRLFQEAFRAGKAVRNETDIQRGATSVGQVAVELAEQLFGDLKDCHVMLLGAGEIARRTAQSLQSRGAKRITIANRGYEKAVELATELGGTAVAFPSWPEQVPQLDIIISSTAAPEPIIRPQELKPGLARRRGGRPLFVIDIAVPRDVDPTVNSLENVYLYDIDALEKIAEQGRTKRVQELEKCHRIVQRFVAESRALRV